MKREEKAERLHQYAEQELRRVNKYHPTLMSPEYIDGGIGPVTVSDALSYRLVAPHIDWDDQRQVGAVKMIIGKAPGQSEQVAYAISEGSIRHLTDHMFEEVAKDMGNQIALELLRLAKTQLRK